MPIMTVVSSAVQLVVLLLLVFTLANIMLAAVSLPLVPLMHNMRGKPTMLQVRSCILCSCFGLGCCDILPLAWLLQAMPALLPVQTSTGRQSGF